MTFVPETQVQLTQAEYDACVSLKWRLELASHMPFERLALPGEAARPEDMTTEEFMVVFEEALAQELATRGWTAEARERFEWIVRNLFVVNGVPLSEIENAPVPADRVRAW